MSRHGLHSPWQSGPTPRVVAMNGVPRCLEEPMNYMKELHLQSSAC